jgi:hypothetical protein
MQPQVLQLPDHPKVGSDFTQSPYQNNAHRNHIVQRVCQLQVPSVRKFCFMIASESLSNFVIHSMHIRLRRCTSAKGIQANPAPNPYFHTPAELS